MSWANRHRTYKLVADKTYLRANIFELEDSAIVMDSSAGVRAIVLPEMTKAEDGFRLRVRRAGANNVTLTAHTKNGMEAAGLGGVHTISVNGDTSVLCYFYDDNAWWRVN
jgi:hypothetical protein